ncbi:hypothetical protein [Nocardioides sp. YIM 152315]|uniref:hypothetical protein n=1 Tax=Nocardioides sp. YIM 152315 TaxID=3031760 RepID=UPI0023DAB5D5|nr:hypothetical protein [Nocardioides sp. YIM 152315]MDF1602940.1 hypothetical protein [Nocardioides sp. YIM 152315]
MTRAPARVRRGALWRAAPLRLPRTPGWLLLVLVAATLFVASVVAPPMFAATARATALAEGLRAVAGAPYGPESADLRATWDGVLLADGDALLMDRLDALRGYGAPVVTASGVAQNRTRRAVVQADGRTRPSEIWYRDGAVAALGGDEDADGVWLAADVAGDLGLEPGDRLRLGLVQTFLTQTPPTLARTTLAGTYETAPGSALPAALADDPDSDRWFVPFDPDDPTQQTPLAIAGRRAFDRLVVEAGEAPLYLADLAIEPGIDPDDAAAAVTQVQRLADDAFDSREPLYGALGATKPPGGAELDVLTGLPDIAFETDGTARTARDQVRPYAVAGQVLAAALLVAAWVLLGRSRRREQLLVSGLGLRPSRLAALAGLEALPVALLAVPLGLGLACLGVLTAGPPTEAGLVVARDDVVRAAVAAGVGLALVVGTAALSAVGTDSLARLSLLGRGRRAVPWTAALLAATAAVAVAVFTIDVTDRAEAPLTMALPVLVAGSVAVLVARAVAWLRSRRPARARPGGARWLATRRTGPVVREVTALTAVVAVGLGLFAYALTVHRGIDEGVTDKTAALAGAATTIEVAEDFRGGGSKGARTARLVTPPADDTSIVWRGAAALPPEFGAEPLMAVDPDSFAAVADWGASGELDAGRELLPQLDREAEGLPVLLAGETDLEAGDRGTLDFSSEFQIPFQVVGVVAAFPGSETETGGVTVVADALRLFRLVLPTVHPGRRGSTSDDAGGFTSEVWSRDSAHVLRRGLAGAGISTDGEVSTRAQAQVGGGLVASTWAAGYVLALGVVVLVLAVAGALVLALRLADRDSVSDVLLGRMGWRAAELARSRAWEVGYAVATAVLAAVLASGVLVLVPTIVDATATVPPLTRPRPGLVDVVVLAVVLVVTVLVAWLLGAWRARRRHPAEVLRAGV